MPGSDHLPQRGLGGDVDGAGVVGARRAGHDARVLAELAPHLLDDRAGGLADGADRQRAEEEDEHHAEEAADEHVDVREVDRQLRGQRNARGAP